MKPLKASEVLLHSSSPQSNPIFIPSDVSPQTHWIFSFLWDAELKKNPGAARGLQEQGSMGATWLSLVGHRGGVPASALGGLTQLWMDLAA